MDGADRAFGSGRVRRSPRRFGVPRVHREGIGRRELVANPQVQGYVRHSLDLNPPRLLTGTSWLCRVRCSCKVSTCPPGQDGPEDEGGLSQLWTSKPGGCSLLRELWKSPSG